MPTNTYTPIASVTLSATASEVVFSGLPQTFRDLIVVAQFITGANANIRLRANGDTASNYSTVRMYGGPGPDVGSDTLTTTYANIESGETNTQQNSIIINAMDYSATDKHKTFLVRGNQNYVSAYANRWASNTAINSLQIFPDTSSFSSGSTFTVFGVIA
jgi:hypothetical protein